MRVLAMSVSKGEFRSINYSAFDGQTLFAVTAGDPKLSSLVLMHGGGPDHQSLLPLGRQLLNCCRVILPDIRGYGRSICRDAGRHTWAQYADDVAALLDHLGLDRAFVGGAGLGSTVALRFAQAYPERAKGLILISVEDIEDDDAKQLEVAFMEAFAERVRSDGIDAAWAPILPDLAPIIGVMVRDAIPRSDPASIAAAASIGYDRSFRSVNDLASIEAPALIFPGMDARHPPGLARNLARMLKGGEYACTIMSPDIDTAHTFASAFAPEIAEFIARQSAT
ncbi:MAG: alpha/beta fold hydrolase [Sinimarinibacterium flocculans]|uniref:alpha/beta fold hydrolase n=1 Tax=Sinimarinibacterium flocculans TaxID=985250 RepID=UPI003C59465A